MTSQPLLIKRHHSFAIPANIMCMVDTDMDIVHGFFGNSFHPYEGMIMRKFYNVAENGMESPDEMLIGEGVVISVEMD